ncbi:MAG: zf-HC2 domain-containing protein [Proteobacteria bacterium]|nr:zf-HC2 domain-containing protein [Pseudomonadota bacterium]
MTDHDHVQDINCEDVLKHLVDYLHGEVEDAKHAEIEKHLDSCRSCFSRTGFEKALKDRVRDQAKEKATEALQDRLKDLMDKF